jgi:RHS repeat-associated protein
MANWSQFTSDTTAQTRGANRQNEITSISGLTTPTYDNNGNTIRDEKGNTLVYDAWNRIVEYRTAPRPNGTSLGTYAYDALGRRIQEPITSTTARDLYFSKDWQVLEERDNAMPATLERSQYVWSPVYVDALVLRDRDPNGTGRFDERLYVQQDANWNVTAVIDTSGNVKERYVYDPYRRFTDPTGQNTTVLNPDWTAHPGGSQYAWVYLHQGGRFDIITGLYYFRHRDYSPTLGRWMEQDPLTYEAGSANFYAYVSDDPVTKVDPQGLWSFDADGFPVSSLISPSKSIAGWSATVTAIACSTTEERLRRNRMIYVIKAKAILLNGEPTSAIALERVQKAIFMFNGGP